MREHGGMSQMTRPSCSKKRSRGWGGRSRSWGAVQLGAGLQVPADEEGKEGVTRNEYNPTLASLSLASLER